MKWLLKTGTVYINLQQSDEKDSLMDRRKYTRVEPQAIDKITVTIDSPVGAIECAVLNISYRGLGIVLPKGMGNFLKLGQELSVQISLDGQNINLLCKVKRQQDVQIGMQFLVLDESSRKLIAAYLDPRYLGSEMQQVDAELIQHPGQYLFLGPNGSQLSIHEKISPQQKRISVELRFLDYYIVINEDNKVYVGEVEETTDFLDEEEIIRATAEVKKKRQILNQACKIIDYTAVTDSLREQLLKKFNDAADALK